MRFGGACTRIRTQHMLYKIYVLFQSCRCPNLEQSVEDSVSYKSFLSEDSERSFSGMRKIPVEADFLFFYSTVPGKAMEFSVENMHAFVIIENYSYYSFINTIDLLCPSIWTRFVLHCWFYMHLIGKQSEVTIYEGNAYWFTSIVHLFSGFYSWRNHQEGSWFIQALCIVLENYGSKMELLHMLTQVNRMVTYEFESCSDEHFTDEVKQMPCIVSMLTRYVYFRPKKPDIRD